MLSKKAKIRLTKLANFISKLPRKKWDFSCFKRDCGTIGCAAGIRRYIKTGQIKDFYP